ncbi:MAG: dockerin type I domain-containing protein [Bacillota bacterium]|nr:dockerin type I domain-containing protein [Bacillota bacterium]
MAQYRKNLFSGSKRFQGLYAGAAFIIVVALFFALIAMTPSPAGAQLAVTTVVSAGNSHTLAIRGDGSVWSWGYNGFGQLGDGTREDRHSPEVISGLTNVKAVSAGNGFSLAVKTDGTVWSWGRNNLGQLGNATKTERTTPGAVSNLTGVSMVSAGYGHSLALKNDGTVWTWGYNTYGQLGDSTFIDRTIPVRISCLSNVKAVSAGYNHSLALKSDGTVLAWGQNNWGQLGDNSTTSRARPVQVANLTGIVAVSAGRYHSMALKDDGTVWTWGRNDSGQLGIGTETSRITPVEVKDLIGVAAIGAGDEHSLAAKTNGTVWTWGSNSYGQLGDGTGIHRLLPVQAAGLTGAKAIAAGNNNSFALKTDSTLWGWGSNGSGQLGDGTTVNRGYPMQVKFTHTIVVGVNPPVYGTAAGGGEYENGAIATVVATPNKGYVFVNWTERGTVVSTRASYSFEVTSSRNLKATFKAAPDVLRDYLNANYTDVNIVASNKGSIQETHYSDFYSYTTLAGRNLLFALSWTEDDDLLDLQVFSPGGFQYTFSNIITYRDLNIVIGRFDNAVAGTWTYRIYGRKVDGNSVDYSTHVALHRYPADSINPDQKTGDINDDDVIDINDVVMVMQYVLGSRTLTSSQRQVADVNGDGKIDVIDVSLIMRKALGLITEFPS